MCLVATNLPYIFKVVFTLQNEGSYNQYSYVLIYQSVVFTLQNKGSYNFTLHFFIMEGVAFTLQNWGSYNLIEPLPLLNIVVLPFKIGAVTTLRLKN